MRASYAALMAAAARVASRLGFTSGCAALIAARYAARTYAAPMPHHNSDAHSVLQGTKLQFGVSIILGKKHIPSLGPAWDGTFHQL